MAPAFPMRMDKPFVGSKVCDAPLLNFPEKSWTPDASATKSHDVPLDALTTTPWPVETEPDGFTGVVVTAAAGALLLL